MSKTSESAVQELIAKELTVASRSSPLAKVQVCEIQAEISKKFPNIILQPKFIETDGDTDLTTSLRNLGKTDFFTRQLDEMVANGECRIAIHAAKDLPDPLPEGLSIVAITAGLDPSDSLVLRTEETLDSLPMGAIIATSSERREQAAQQLRSDFKFIDLRGTIGQRLEKLQTKEADGVIVAEAALIRLGLTGLNRIKLPGDTVPYQGQLAIVARTTDLPMRQLFSWIDSRKDAVLYLGLALQKKLLQVNHIHYPVIQTVPVAADHPDVKAALSQLSQFTHLLFTSKTAVNYFFDLCSEVNAIDLKNKKCIAIGRATAEEIEKRGGQVAIMTQNECSEGLIEELKGHQLQDAYLFWPHSALSRPVITNYFKSTNIRYLDCVLYTTELQKIEPIPNLDAVGEIQFTSPSTVDNFITLFGPLPATKQLTPIGPVTECRLALNTH